MDRTFVGAALLIVTLVCVGIWASLDPGRTTPSAQGTEQPRATAADPNLDADAATPPQRIGDATASSRDAGSSGVSSAGPAAVETPSLPVVKVPSNAETPGATPDAPAPAGIFTTSSGERVPLPASLVPGDPPVRIPAALAQLAPTVRFNETQMAKLDQLADEFVRSVGGPNQDPYSPEYRQRWEAAMSANDRRFILFFGRRAWVAQDTKIHQEAAALTRN